MGTFDWAGYPRKLADRVGWITGTVVRKEARARARVQPGSGANRNSIRLEKTGPTTHEVSANMPYSAVQEYGHPNYPSVARPPGEPKSGRGGPYTFNPYMRPAAKIARDEMRETVRKAAQSIGATG